MRSPGIKRQGDPFERLYEAANVQAERHVEKVSAIQLIFYVSRVWTWLIATVLLIVTRIDSEVRQH